MAELGNISVETQTHYLRISEAVAYLGCSSNTLRNWINAGKISAIRHRVNDNRLFFAEEGCVGQ